MDVSIVLKAMLALSGLALLFGILLAVASIRFHVETDPRVDEVLDVLMGSNCGACGYPGCQPAAEAVVAGKASADVCVAGGTSVAEAVARVMGVEVSVRERGVALVHCRGGVVESAPKAHYQGIKSCAAADKIAGGGKACRYGCIGLGTCKVTCPVSAITMDEDGRRWVDRDRCTGCGLCVEVCPRGLIQVVPRYQEVLVVCNSRDKGVVSKRLCKVSCIACRKCEKVCGENAIRIEDNRAWIDYDACVECGDCVEACPTGAIMRVAPPRGRRGKVKPPSEAGWSTAERLASRGAIE